METLIATCVPGAFAGVTHCTNSGDCHFAGTTVAPKLHAKSGELRKPVPRTLTTVLPVEGPLLGETPETLSKAANAQVQAKPISTAHLYGCHYEG